MSFNSQKPKRLHASIEASLGFAVVSVLFFSVPTSRAQSLPTVDNSTPFVLQRGESVELTLTGQHLAKVSEAFVPAARGLAAKIVRPPAATQPATQPSAQISTSLRIQLTATDDAALGERELRLVSPTGVSAPLHVTVSQYPHAPENEPNNTPELAQAVVLPAVLTGKMDAPGDVDCFRFSGRKDSPTIFDVHAARSGSKLDPIVIVHDMASGRELPVSVDTHGGDPTVIFTAPADGEYEMEIRDLEFRGGNDFTYRIDAGPIPYVRSVLPLSAAPGGPVQLRPIGFNLQGLDRLPLDLSYSILGPISIHGQSSMGVTNDVPFEITDLPVYVQKGQNHSADHAESAPFPADITGQLDAAGDEDFFAFHLDHPQAVLIDAIGKKMGSAIDALVTLRNIKGDAIMTSDDTAVAGARMSRALSAGDYLVSIRDLTYHGGSSYAYRLRLRPGTAATGQDFAVKFLPDAIRVSQGGSTAVFCDIQRIGGFKGNVTLTIEGLPPGITVPQVVLTPTSSDVFTISATREAYVGTYPIRVIATAMIDNRMVSRTADAMLGERPVRQAYLSVLEPAPFTIEALTTLAPPRVQQLNSEANSLAAKLATPTPEFLAGQAAWEKTISVPLVWTALDNAKATAVSTKFQRLADGSFLATGESPEKDTYTVVATIHEPNITAIRLEAIPDDSLPQKGPGRAPADGNFVLSRFAAAYAPADDPDKKTPLPLVEPRALLEQAGYPIIDALEPKPNKGWAMSPYKGRLNAAYFFTAAPIGGPTGTTFTFTLDHQFNSRFTIGRFRLSVTSDNDAKLKAAIPMALVDAAATPAARRMPEQRAALSAYYRASDPRIAADTARLDVLRASVGPAAELARIEGALNAPAPQLDAERIAWEKRVPAGHAWLPVDFNLMKSQSGATLTKQPDGSILVSGVSPATDVYTLTGAPPVRTITAVRIEALPDSRLPGNGPGRAGNGNFVLTKLLASAVVYGPASSAQSIELRGATASFQQPGFSPLGALDDRDDTGWAVMPNLGLPSQATFYTKEAFATDGTSLSIVLEQKYPGVAQHTLGRFRVWVTSNPDPDSAPMIPADILGAIRTPADKRDAAQKAAVLSYYKATAAISSAPLEYRAEELKAQLAAAATAVETRPANIPMLLNRNNFAGPVQVTLEGFSANRKRPLAQNLKFDPQRLAPNALAGTFSFTPQPTAETGTRMAVLRAEAKIGDETYVEYSPAFPVTVVPMK